MSPGEELPCPACSAGGHLEERVCRETGVGRVLPPPQGGGGDLIKPTTMKEKSQSLERYMKKISVMDKVTSVVNPATQQGLL